MYARLYLDDRFMYKWHNFYILFWLVNGITDLVECCIFCVIFERVELGHVSIGIKA